MWGLEAMEETARTVFSGLSLPLAGLGMARLHRFGSREPDRRRCINCRLHPTMRSAMAQSHRMTRRRARCGARKWQQAMTEIRTTPATPDRWNGVVSAFGRRGDDPGWCWCRRFLDETPGAGVDVDTDAHKAERVSGSALFTGTLRTFLAAGFSEVTRTFPSRPVMRRTP